MFLEFFCILEIGPLSLHFLFWIPIRTAAWVFSLPLLFRGPSLLIFFWMSYCCSLIASIRRKVKGIAFRHRARQSLIPIRRSHRLGHHSGDKKGDTPSQTWLFLLCIHLSGWGSCCVFFVLGQSGGTKLRNSAFELGSWSYMTFYDLNKELPGCGWQC